MLSQNAVIVASKLVIERCKIEASKTGCSVSSCTIVRLISESFDSLPHDDQIEIADAVEVVLGVAAPDDF